MPQSKTYYRKCEYCGYETKVSSGWSRHQKTKKHLEYVKLLENKVKLLETENELLKLGHTTNNTYNNTINNVDNININVFTPNPDAINLKDIVIPILKELAKYKIVPAIAIQKAVIDMGIKKPILYHNSSLYVKQGEWKKDTEAEKELDVYCRDTQHKLICELDKMDMEDELYVDAMVLAYEPLDRDAVLHKVKSKLIKN
jgi:hypothetical protein